MEITMAEAQKDPQGIQVLLTGGAGFLGQFIVRELLDPQCPIPLGKLTVLDLNELQGNDDPRLYSLKGDVRDSALLKEACAGQDLVIHSAAIVDWGTKSREEILSVNVEGTRLLLEAAREAGAKAFLYTSSLDVLVDGRPLLDVDEDTPYPQKHATSYCESKYLSEVHVRKANSESLPTCVLRPSDIYGEADPYHMGSLIDMARKGFYVSIGRGKARCQHVYAGNMAHAHVLAAKALLDGNEQVRGKAYFITDGPGTNFFDFFNPIVAASGYRIWPKNLRLPCGFAYVIGWTSEALAVLARPFKKYTPKMSRFAVTYTCTSYTFNAQRAAEEFGFSPKYSEQEAFERTAAYFRKKM